MLSDFLRYYLFDYEIGVYPKYTDLNDGMIKKKMDHFSQVLMKDDTAEILGIVACFYDKNRKIWKCKSTGSDEVVSFEDDTLVIKFFYGDWKILVLPYFLFENQKVTDLKKRIVEEKMDLFESYKEYVLNSEFIWREHLEAVNIDNAKQKLEAYSETFKKKEGHNEAYQKLYCLIIFNKNAEIDEQKRQIFADSFALTIKEWGLDILHEEIIKHATKAAVAAIMSRNMSHNIGSHVLSYWKNELDAGNILLCEYLSGMADASKRKLIEDLFDSKKVEKKESGNYIEKSYFLFDYLKNRMDFIAEITTTPPSWEKSINLYAIIQRLWEQKALLDNIILSEGFCYIGDSVVSYKQCLKITKGASKCENCEHKREVELVPYKIKLSNGRNSIKKYDVSIPHGHIGEQAIYSIFENLIRNSAKHGGRKIKEKISNKADSIKMFEININAKDADGFIALTVSDNVGNCNDIIKESTGKERRIIEFLNDGLQDAGDSGYVSSSGQLIKEKWGIKEIKMSANFLRKRTTDSLVDKNQIDDDDREKPLIHLACYESNCRTISNCNKIENKNIAFTFYLRKPKEACMVYSNNVLDQNIINKKDGLQKKGILILTLDEAIDILQKKENIPHRFLVLSSNEIWQKLRENENFNRQRLPLRIIVNDKCTNEREKAALLKEVHSSVDFSKLTNSTDDFIKSIYESYCTKFKEHNITTQMPSDGEKNTSIYFDDHGKSYEKSKIEGIFYYHPYGTTIGKTFYDYFDPYKDKLNEIKPELIEMANVKIVIADERIYNVNQNKKISTQGKDPIDNKLELLRDYMKISVVPVISGVVKEEDVLKDKNAGDFLIIHQGLIDKMENKIQFIKAVRDKYSFIVIDSGRGVPSNLEKDTRYIEIGAIERFVEELDKNSLIQTLFSLRRPNHV